MARVTVITGSSSGIGLATAIAFARLGDSVVATVRDQRGEARLRTAAQGAAVDLEISTLDVTDDASVARLIDLVMGRHGRVDVLVNNAGLGYSGTLEELSLNDLRRSLEVNFFGVARMTKAVLPAMRAAGQGRVIVVSSLGGVVGQPFNDAYCAAKFAVEGLYESLHPVAARSGVHVSIVEPGPVGTDFRGHSGQAEGEADAALAALKDAYLATMAAGSNRAQSADAVAEVIVAVAGEPAPKLRYQTSRFTARLVGIKLADLSGDQITGLTSTWLGDSSVGGR